MQQLNKRWYFPGLISLIGLFPLCYGYINWRGFLKENYVIPIRLVDKSTEYSWLSDQGWFLKKSDYKVHAFTLKGPLHDSTALQKIDSFAHHLIVSEDTINRIFIHFSSTATSQSLVNVYDLCKKNKVRRYYFNSKHFLIWYQKPLVYSTINMVPFMECATSRLMMEEGQRRMQEEKDAAFQALQIAIGKDVLWASLILLGTLILFKYLTPTSISPPSDP